MSILEDSGRIVNSALKIGTTVLGTGVVLSETLADAVGALNKDNAAILCGKASDFAGKAVGGHLSLVMDVLEGSGEKSRAIGEDYKAKALASIQQDKELRLNQAIGTSGRSFTEDTEWIEAFEDGLEYSVFMGEIQTKEEVSAYLKRASAGSKAWGFAIAKLYRKEEALNSLCERVGVPV